MKSVKSLPRGGQRSFARNSRTCAFGDIVEILAVNKENLPRCKLVCRTRSSSEELLGILWLADQVLGATSRYERNMLLIGS